MIIHRNEINDNQFYDNHIKHKKPLLIKGFFNPENLKQALEESNEKIKPLYSRGAVPFLYVYFNDEQIRNIVFNLPIIKELKNKKWLKFRNEMRLWNHNAGNVSNFHYDQRSTDLLNVCLSGSKKWSFLPPENPLKCWPFYNIALPFQSKQKSKAITLIMEQGDLVYIPRNWYHQVDTLENNTQNINVIFNDLIDHKMQCREKELAAIKNTIFPNYQYGDNIEVLNNEINNVKKSTMIKRFIQETSPIILIMLVVLFII